MIVFKDPKPSGRKGTRALPKNGVYRLEGDRSYRMVRCLQGVLWITQEGDWRDRVLQVGEVYRTRLPGFVLVQALDPSRMEVIQEKKGMIRPFPWLALRKFNNA